MFVMMPDINGGDLTADLLEQSDLAEEPIVFITAAIRKDEARAHHGRVGGRLYLAKPVSTEEIIQVVESELGPYALSISSTLRMTLLSSRP